jgi:hypothetical protein
MSKNATPRNSAELPLTLAAGKPDPLCVGRLMPIRHPILWTAYPLRWSGWW